MEQRSYTYGSGTYGQTSQYGAFQAGNAVHVGHTCPIDAVNLGYVSAPGPMPLENINIISNINDESLNISGGFSGTLTSVATAFTDNLILTDKTCVDGLGNTYPLWYKYKSRYMTYDTTGSPASAGGTISYIEQDGGGPLPGNHRYIIEKEPVSGMDNYYYLVVYANFKGNFDVIYKINYTRYDDSGNVITARTGTKYRETINFAPVFKQLSDYPAADAEQVYYAEHFSTGYAIYIPATTYPDRSQIYVHIEGGKQVYLDSPACFTKKDNWYIRVHRGSLTDASRRVIGYYDQQFHRYVPIVRIRKEKAIVIGESLIRVSRVPMVVENDMPIDVYVNDTCITRTASGDPLENPNLGYDRTVLKDVIGDRGTIELEDYYLNETDNVFVNYYYYEYYYCYRGFTDSVGHFVHLDVNPNAGHYFTDIFFADLRTASRDPLITGATRFAGLHRKTVDLIGCTIYLYWRPDGTIFHAIENVSGYSDYKVATRFVHDGHTTFRYAGDTYTDTISVSGDTVLLGSIRIAPELPKPILLDARCNGGGLMDDVGLVNEGELWWDKTSWDGDPFQVNGVAILDANTTSFTKDYIGGVLDKFKALGTTILLSNRTGTNERSNDSPYA